MIFDMFTQSILEWIPRIYKHESKVLQVLKTLQNVSWKVKEEKADVFDRAVRHSMDGRRVYSLTVDGVIWYCAHATIFGKGAL